MARRPAVVVLAAGRGVRMRSDLPKVLHEAGGRPLLDRVLETARAFAGADGPLVVVAGAGRERVVPHVARVAPGAVIVVQDPPLGTGDAVRVASRAFGDAGRVAVLSGDVPLLTVESLRALEARLDGDPRCKAAFLTMAPRDPGAYGRIVRDGAGDVVRNVEAKDATREEREIREVNAGIYLFDRAFLDSALPKLKAENASGEFYLTDVLGLATAVGERVAGIPVGDAAEVLGVNSKKELAALDALLRLRAAERAMEAGATLIRPETITLDETVVLEPDAAVEPFVSLFGATRVGSGTRIGQGSVVRDSTFGRGVVVKPYCVIDGARVADGAIVGPFARLREGTDLREGVHVGNYVETKKARLGKGVKANHLTYLGDVAVGEGTNVGAGVITCNYDGFAKHETTIGANVFVGSDVQLVAPVTVGDGAIIGAGTTVTRDVPDDALVTSRAPLKIVEGGGAAYRARKKAASPPKKGA